MTKKSKPEYVSHEEQVRLEGILEDMLEGPLGNVDEAFTEWETNFIHSLDKWRNANDFTVGQGTKLQQIYERHTS